MPRAKKENMYNDPFPTRLRALMEAQKVTQATLAEHLGIQRQTLNAYTLGETTPDIKRLVGIAEYFDVTYDYLLGKSDSRKRENVNITERTGLSDTSIAMLEKRMQAGIPPETRQKYVSAINTLLSSDELLKYMVTFFSIEGDESGQFVLAEDKPKHGLYALAASPDVYAAAMMSRIQYVMERLRTEGKAEREAFPPAYREMVSGIIDEVSGESADA